MDLTDVDQTPATSPDPRPEDVVGPDPTDTSPNGLTPFDPSDQDVSQDPEAVYDDADEE
jgi:hypothetical protein